MTNEKVEALRRRILEGRLKIQQEHDKLTAVLREYPIFSRTAQLYLAESVIMRTISTMATHPEREIAHDHFRSAVEMLYSDTYDADEKLSERERENARVAASAVFNRVQADANRVFNEAAAGFARLDGDHAFRIVADALARVLTRFMDHASEGSLQALIAHCCVLCIEIECCQSGMDRGNEVVACLQDVARDTAAVRQSVVDAIGGERLTNTSLTELINLLPDSHVQSLNLGFLNYVVIDDTGYRLGRFRDAQTGADIQAVRLWKSLAEAEGFLRERGHKGERVEQIGIREFAGMLENLRVDAPPERHYVAIFLDEGKWDLLTASEAEDWVREMVMVAVRTWADAAPG